MDGNSWGNVGETGSWRVDELVDGGDDKNFWKGWIPTGFDMAVVSTR